jgi:acyl-CoA thioester hydrolase
MTESFQVWITVRGYELDTQGHLNNAVYHQYGEHARWEYVRAAGISVDTLRAAGVGPVVLEHHQIPPRVAQWRQGGSVVLVPLG